MKLDLAERTQKFALSIVFFYVSLPKSTEAQVLGKQVLRSGTSVGANYIEGTRSRSKNEFTAKIGVSLQELEETRYWLELLLMANIATEVQVASILQEAKELIAILTTISKKVKSSD